MGQLWESDFEKAQEKAAQENKKLLLIFSGSDWCIPCIRLDREVWQNKDFMAYAKEKLVLYRADFPKRKKNHLSPALATKNNALAEVYNPKGISLGLSFLGQKENLKELLFTQKLLLKSIFKK